MDHLKSKESKSLNIPRLIPKFDSSGLAFDFNPYKAWNFNPSENNNKQLFSSFRRVEISKQSNAKRDESNFCTFNFANLTFQLVEIGYNRVIMYYLILYQFAILKPLHSSLVTNYLPSDQKKQMLNLSGMRAEIWLAKKYLTFQTQ